VTFDPVAHAYFDDQGARLPSVSQIIQAAGLSGDPRFYRQGAAERGARVHLALEEIVKHGETLLDDDEIRPYVDSFRDWLAKLFPRPLQAEVKVQGRDPIPYGGTVDLVGEGMLVDYKTGAPAPWHRVQLCAYGLALGIETLGALYLKPGKPAVLRIVSKLEMEDGKAAWRKAASEWGGLA
jgi:hypothetical protein